MELFQPLLTLNWNLLFSAITVIVLFFILKHFFFEKVHNFMTEREKSIRDSLEEADKANKLAEDKLAQYENKIAGIENESRQIIKAARDEAKSQAKDIIDEANSKAHEMIEHSQKEIRREEYNARKQLKEEVGNLAILAAEKIMEKEISHKGHEELINKIIKEAEDEPWS